MNDYQSKMRGVFNSIKPLLISPGNYWQQGCILDTVIDYFQYAINEGAMRTDEAQTYIGSVYDNCYMGMDRHGNPYAQAGCWYDDYGWWGITSSKAFDDSYDQVFGSYKTKYQNIARYCYDIMKNGKNDPNGWYKGAPNVWENCDQSHTPVVAPRFSGGVWQSEIFYKPRPTIPECSGTPENDCECNNSGDPNRYSLGPFQLSVVNTLYFVLGARLAKEIPAIWADVQTQFSFFEQWTNSSILPDEQLVKQFSSDVSLLRERISTYKNGDSVYYYNKDSYWAGDQGLFLGGLVSYTNKFPENTKTSGLINSLTNGVCEKMVSSNKVIQPWLVSVTGKNVYAADEGDYASGSGVFMRYLLFAFKNNSAVKIQVNTKHYQQFLTQSATVYASDYPPNYNNAAFNYFNQLSVLLTASQLINT